VVLIVLAGSEASVSMLLSVIHLTIVCFQPFDALSFER
jgi:hypothetical protein